MITSNIETPLKRIAVFYDGSFFFRLTNYYKYIHPRKAHLTISGLHEYIRNRVASFETGSNVSLCQIVEAHLFRGRFSLSAAKAANSLESDRFIDQLLMYAGVVTHHYPMNEKTQPPEEKGIDVWLALEAYDFAVHKRFDVMVLFAGDQDYLPLVRKVNSLGTRVLVLGIDVKWIEYKEQQQIERFIKTSARLFEEASYKVMLTEEIDSKAAGKVIEGLFER